MRATSRRRTLPLVVRGIVPGDEHDAVGRDAPLRECVAHAATELSVLRRLELGLGDDDGAADRPA